MHPARSLTTLLCGILLSCQQPVDTDDSGTTIETEARVETPEDLYGVGHVRWQQAQPSQARLLVSFGDEQRETPWRTRGSGDVKLAVVGIPPETQVDIVLEIEFDDGGVHQQELQWTSPTIPVDFIVPEIITQTADWDEDVQYLLSSTHNKAGDWSDTWWLFIIDREGTVVWAMPSEEEDGHKWVSRHLTRSADGEALLVDRATAWTRFDHGALSTVVRMTLDGDVHHIYNTPGLHHPFTSLPDGLIAWGARDLKAPHYESIEIVDMQGNQEHIWSCPEAEVTSCGSNTLWWNASTDTFLFSFWSNDTIAEVDRQTGMRIREFGQTSHSWSFSEESQPFSWPHGPIMTSEGTLLVSSKSWDIEQETVVLEYALDETTQTLTEVDRIYSGHYAGFGGEVWRTPNGNTFHGLGSDSHMVEYTPDGAIVWEAKWPEERRVGQTIMLDNLEEMIP